VGAAVAGPFLIVGAVLVVLHDFAFGGRITFAQADVAAYWLPTYCHLGRSLAAGHIAAWNPFSLGGTPFAADPQSGWMYLPVMVLFPLFRCDLAIRLYIVLLPILGGPAERARGPGPRGHPRSDPSAGEPGVLPP